MSARARLALKLLGITEEDIAPDSMPNHGADLLCKKRQLLSAQFEQVCEALSDKRIAEFLSYSKDHESSESVLDLLEAERARNAAIVDRDRARVQAAKRAMEKSITELVASEIARKDLDNRRETQIEAFKQKLAALTDRRHKEAAQRSKSLKEKQKMRESLMNEQEERDDKQREEIQGNMALRLENVAKRKQAIKQEKQHQADLFNEKLETVISALVHADQDRAAAALRMHANLLDRAENARNLRVRLVTDWRSRGKEHARNLHKRKEARIELEDKGEISRHSQEAERDKRAIARHEKISANRQKHRRSRAAAMKSKDKARTAAVDRSKGDRAEHVKQIASAFQEKHALKDRSRRNTRWDDFKQRRADWRSLAEYNLTRVKRIDEFTRTDKIAKMKRINDKIEKLKNVDHVRAEKQKLLRANWLEKLRLECIFSKLRRERNESRFSELVRDLSV